MSKPQPLALLRHASLFLLVAAVIAGIFGMHVVTGSHSAHSVPAVAQAAALPADHHGHSTAGSVNITAPHDATAFVNDSESCSSGSCPGAGSAEEHCIPSLKTGSLTAPLPGTGVASVAAGPTLLLESPSTWSYTPSGPSLNHLSISRT